MTIDSRQDRQHSDDMSILSAQSKRHLENNPLLEALTLVIESNAEYARGVTTILDSDLEREVLLNDIKKDILQIKKLTEQNREDVILFKSQVSSALSSLEKFDVVLAAQLKEKLGPLYKAANLQEDGEDYNPTDKLVVTLQKVLSSKLFTMAAGILIWVAAKLIFEGLK